MAIVYGTNNAETIDASDGVTGNADTIYGYGGADSIFGLGGNDFIIGGAGGDDIDGGSGFDAAFYTDSTVGVFVSLATGQGSGGTAEDDTLTSIENLYGSAYDDILAGNGASNALSGMQGADILKGGGGADSLSGGSGDDTLQGGAGADTMHGGDGTDTLNYATSPERVFVFLLTQQANSGDGVGDSFSGIENVTGSSHDDFIVGDNGVNVLTGGNGNDELIGRGGNDVLVGGDGNDYYVIDDSGDIIVEAVGQGTSDIVSTNVSYALAAGNEIENLHTNDGEATSAIDLTGNEFGQTIIGNDGQNVIDGRGGADWMTGRDGDDTYHADNAGDVTFEAAGAGIDQVLASVSYTLYWQTDIETLATVDQNATTAINLTGNSSGQQIIGNDGDNIINGGGGADQLAGRGGNDIYFVDSTTDTITESGGQGIDEVRTSTSYTLTAGADIEILRTTDDNGTLPLHLTGNSSGNQIIGNNGGNTINGGGGSDQLAGRGGNDTYIVNNANVTIVENGGQGIDTVQASVSYTLTEGADVEYVTTTDNFGFAAIDLTGNSSGNVVIGNLGNNVLNGGGGDDQLFGQAGQDQFLFNTALDAANNIDVIVDFWMPDDTIVLENAIFGAFAAGDLAAERFVVGTAAQDASDNIIYDINTGALFYDSDGTGAAAAIQFAEVSAGLALTHLDFLIV
jgi:Ca2+-binding RTX toxin-like protein